MEEILQLIGGHSLILGSMPEKINLGMVNDKTNKDNRCPDGKCTINSFGLFDTSTPNYATYYPEVTAEDLKPKDDEFIYPVFRLLSAVTVNKNSYSPIYFPEEVLKESMGLLLGQTVFIDHEMTTGNALGAVMEVEWQEAYKTKEGIKVPAGINGKMKLDGKTHPGIARAIMMDPPAIHSNSVTVRFAWEQSHKDMPSDEFYDKLGSVDKDGNLIQKVANKVDSYWETSLVPHGADPFAKKIESNGKITNPRFSGRRDEQFSANVFDYKSQSDTTILDNFKTKGNNNQKSKSSMNKVLQNALLSVLGLTAENLTDENFDFEGTFKSLKEDAAKFNVLNDKVKSLELTEDGFIKEEDFVSFINIDVKKLKEEAEMGTAHLTAQIEEATRLYNLIKGDKAEDAMLTNIKNSNLETVGVFISDFKTESEKMFPLQCNDCESKNVSRMTAKADEGEGKGEEGNSTELSFKDLSSKLRENRRKDSFTDID